MWFFDRIRMKIADRRMRRAMIRALLEAKPDYTWRDSEFRRRCD